MYAEALDTKMVAAYSAERACIFCGQPRARELKAFPLEIDAASLGLDGEEAQRAYFARERETMAKALVDHGVIVLRGFSLAREPEVAARYDDPLARDLHERVLPLLLPRFLRHSCQAPDAFVAGALVLAELWPAERVGNWPRAE